MKKFLSMVLAMVMTLSLVTVSAGAKEFPDNDQLTDANGVYEEAVNVLSEMGIIDGDTDGNFKPKGTLTRGAASKIIACMMLGKTTAESLGTAAAPFKDVPVGSTFAGYIAYCVEQGIIDGYADGTFRPSGALTGYAFQKMLLTALGYDSKIEGYANNPNWRVNVAGRAQQEGLLKGLDASSYNASESATREQACLMALNTIKTPLVEYENKGSTLTVNGATISQSASAVKYVTTVDRSRATAIDDKQYQTTATGTDNSYFVEFGEQYQPDLRRDFIEDDFGRPAYTWMWQKNEIDTYVDYSLLIAEYNTGVTGRALREAIGQTAIDEAVKYNNFSYYVDGVLYKEGTTKYIDHVELIGIDPKDDLVRGNETDAGMTKNGVLTQVFLDRDHGAWELTITSIDTWLAKANSDYNKTAEELSLTAYTSKTTDQATGTKNLKVDVEEVPSIENVKKDDFVLITRSGKDGNAKNETRPALRVVGMSDVEILSDTTVTQFSKGDKQIKDSDPARAINKLTTGGTEYNFSQKCFYDAEALDEYDHSLLTNMTYDVYLDAYGYVIGVNVHEGNRNYVFISAYDTPNTALINRSATATAIFLDGSIQNITVNVKDTNTNIDNTYTNNKNATERYFNKWAMNKNPQHNRWYTYTVNTAGVYTLKPAERMLIDATNFAAAKDNVVSLNSANLSLRAVSALNTSKTTATTTRAYGNDDSIYITVNTDQATVDSMNADQNRTIDDIQGVYTGAQNVKLDLREYQRDTTPAVKTGIPEHIYALYDSDNYIIAAIVVGEAQGNISNYAYICSDAKSEKYEDGYYYWTFEGIQNGEFKTFTARSKFSDTMTNLVKYHMMQLLFDGDYVSKVSTIGNVGHGTDANSKFYTDNTKLMDTYKDDVDVYDVGHVATPDSNTWYEDSCGGTLIGITNTQTPKANGTYRLNGTIRFIGGTLYVDPSYNNSQNTDTGLAVRSNAKAVVIQHINRDRKVVEYSSVTDAINALRDPSNKPGMQFQGRIVAPLRDGVAQWVVIISDTQLRTASDAGLWGGEDDVTGTNNKTESIRNTNISLTVDANANSVTNYVNARNAVITTKNNNGDLVIAIPTTLADGTTVAPTFTLTVNGASRNAAVTTVPTRVVNGQLTFETSGLGLDSSASWNVVFTLNSLGISTPTTPEKPVEVPDDVKDVVEEVVINTKPDVAAGEEAVIPTGATVGKTEDGKLTLTIPADSNPDIDENTTATVTLDDGSTVEGTFEKVGNNWVFTSTNAVNAAGKKATFSFVKKQQQVVEEGLPTYDAASSNVARADVTYSYTDDGVLVIQVKDSAVDEIDYTTVEVKRYGTTITAVPTGVINPTRNGDNWVWQFVQAKTAYAGTTITVNTTNAEDQTAAENAAKTKAVTEAAAKVGDGSAAVKEELQGLADAEANTVPYATDVTVPTAKYNETNKTYEIILDGTLTTGQTYPAALTSSAAFNTTTKAVAVPVNFPVPEGAVKAAMGRKDTKTFAQGETVTVTAPNPEATTGFIREVSSFNEDGKSFDFVAFLRPANTNDITATNKLADMTIKLTWVDENDKALADTVTFVIKGDAITVQSQGDAFKAAATAVADQVNGNLNNIATADKTAVETYPIVKNVTVTPGTVNTASTNLTVVPLTVTGTHTLVTGDAGKFDKAPLNFVAGTKAETHMLIPLALKIPEGATGFKITDKTAAGPKVYKLGDADKTAGYNVLTQLIALTPAASASENPSAPTEKTVVTIQWTYGDFTGTEGTDSFDFADNTKVSIPVEYQLDCSGVTVEKPTATP